MSTTNRSALINKIYKTLKRHYHPTVSRSEQPVLESLLYACCLENTPPATAEEVYAAIKSSFFDWNEVRVSTVKELAEVMEPLYDATAAAGCLKLILQNVFESDYSFDLESLKKQNLGAAVKRLQKLQGTTPFSVAYATQTALGGHSIPLDRAALETLYMLGVISQAEGISGTVSGLERAIPKNKGQEFGSLLHQLGSDYLANPFSPQARELILGFAPDAKQRLPKRGAKKPALATEPVPPPTTHKKPPAKAPAPAVPQKAGPQKKAAEPPAKSLAKPATAKPATTKPATAKPVAAKSSTARPAAKPAVKKPQKHPVHSKQVASGKPLARKKPR